MREGVSVKRGLKFNLTNPKPLPHRQAVAILRKWTEREHPACNRTGPREASKRVAFDHTQPCGDCPYKAGVRYYTAKEALPAVGRLFASGHPLVCHLDGDFDRETKKHFHNREMPRHCAGALLFFEALGLRTAAVDEAVKTGRVNLARVKAGRRRVYASVQDFLLAHDPKEEIMDARARNRAAIMLAQGGKECGAVVEVVEV